MQVEQAIFTSVQDGRVRGYQLAARSPGVDSRTEKVLTQWGPSHAALCSDHPAAESYNLHPVEDDLFALSRTMYGGPEYSERGGLEMVTRYALLRRDQFEPFENDAVAMIRQARSEGGFQFEREFAETLSAMHLADATPGASWLLPISKSEAAVVPDAVGRLRRGERVAITHCCDPLAMLQNVLREFPPAERLTLSFTTGLKPTAHRPFRLHVLPGDSAEQRRSATAQGLVCLNAGG